MLSSLSTLTILLILSILAAFFYLPPRQVGGDGSICKTDALDFHRRYNSKKYLSSTSLNRPPYSEGSAPPQDYTSPPAGHPLLTASPDNAPLDRLTTSPQEPSISPDVPRYTEWLLKQRGEKLNPLDRSNLTILKRGGQLQPSDLPAKYSPPENSQTAYETLLKMKMNNVEHLTMPEYLGFLPANFDIADEKQVSMHEFNYINPNERLHGWELTHFRPGTA
jgi:hypothetical protein